jgi:integrase
MKSRQHGLGTVFRHHKGSDVWWIQYSAHGKRYRESSGSTDEKVAKHRLKQRIADIIEKRPVGAAVEKITLDDLITLVENKYKADGLHTLNRVQAAAAHLREYYGGERKARNITDDTVVAYSAHRLEEGAASSTINCELAVLLRGFRLGRKKVPVIPEIKKLKVNNVRKGFFEPDQFRAVLKHLPAHLVPVARVLYITGWRKGELLSRMWKHADLRAGWLKLEPGETKNLEGRNFPFTPELREVLEAQRKRLSEIERETERIVPWIFPLPTGERIGDFRKAWATACKNAGVAGRLVHDFRRTAVRNLERAGVPRSSAMLLTGHRTEAVYRRYAINDSAMLQEAVAKLAVLHGTEER